MLKVWREVKAWNERLRETGAIGKEPDKGKNIEPGGHAEKGNIRRMAELAARSPELEADNITGEHSTDVIERGKQYYLANLYGRKINSPAIDEDVEFTARGLLYLGQKGTPEQQARRFKLLPKVMPIIERMFPFDFNELYRINC